MTMQHLVPDHFIHQKLT
jgi:hypothetical protein